LIRAISRFLTVSTVYASIPDCATLTGLARIASTLSTDRIGTAGLSRMLR
jgi:hypothetical protein